MLKRIIKKMLVRKQLENFVDSLMLLLTSRFVEASCDAGKVKVSGHVCSL